MKQSRTYYVAGITLFLLTLAFGGYYEFVNTIFSGVLILYFLFEVFVKKAKPNLFTDSFWFGLVLLAGYAISIMYAVDRGIAAEGLAKKSLFFVWGCILLLLTQKERHQLLGWVPYIGSIMTITCCITYFIAPLKEYSFQLGRLGGWFQYANTCGGFLLIGFVLILLKEKRNRLDYCMLPILLAGMFLTGSRSTILLFFFAIIYFIIKIKALRKWLLIFTGLLIVTLVCLSFFGNWENTLTRITTIVSNSSTLFGRALYNYDGIHLLLKQPLGLGYLGFFFIQTSIQTGIYSVRYIHNDWLQIGLDIGIVWMLLILFLIVANLWKMRKSNTFLVLLLLFLHGFAEFNLEYSVMGLLIMLCLNEQSLPKIPTKACKKVSIGLCSILLLPLLYISIPLTLSYFDNSDACIALYPFETNEKLKLLSSTQDEMQASALADEILMQNPTCSLAYDAKAIVSINNGLYPEAIYFLNQSIHYSRFYPQAYEQLEWLLTQIIEQGVTDNNDFYIEEYNKLQKLKQKNQDAVSYFGKKINQKVNLIKQSN